MMPKRKNESESEVPEGAPMNKLAPIFSNKRMHGVWKSIPGELFVFTPDGMENRAKVAGFDMDGTLIKTISGNVFPKNNDDWQLWDKVQVVKELSRAHANGYKLCIFTNQKGVQMKSVDPAALKQKIQAIISLIDLPIQVFVSLGTPNYRKPYVGMWERLEAFENGGIAVDRSQSVYVGDAAGRDQTKLRKKDHSCADRLFALNLGVSFKTPEQYFLGKPEEEPYTLPLSPSSVNGLAVHNLFDPVHAKIPGAAVEILVLVGSPASGKSHLAEKWAMEHNYAVVSQDELKTYQNCLKAAREHLLGGRSIIVDCTNRDLQTRARYLDLAKSMSLVCRCFVFKCTFEEARHNNAFRKIAFTDKQHEGVNDMVLRMFFKGYQVPSLEEGFEEIVHVNFLPTFKDEEHRKIYNMHLLEK